MSSNSCFALNKWGKEKLEHTLDLEINEGNSLVATV